MSVVFLFLPFLATALGAQESLMLLQTRADRVQVPPATLSASSQGKAPAQEAVAAARTAASSKNSTARVFNMRDVPQLGQHGAARIATGMRKAPHSLMQTSSATQDAKSSPTFAAKTIAEKLDALKANLMEAQREHEEEMARKKASYEAQLKTQQKVISASQDANQRTVKEIQDLQLRNRGLRDRAAVLEKRRGALTEELVLLKMNISTAEQFADESLRKVEKDAAEDTLAVLSELDAKEKDASVKDAENKRLNEIFVDHANGVGELSFLQVTSSSSSSDSPRHGHNAADPAGMLQSLGNGFDSLFEAQEGSEAELEQSVNEARADGERRLAELAQEATELDSKKASVAELGVRLRAAVSALEAACHGLEERNHALRAFAQRIAGGAVGTSGGSGAARKTTSLLETPVRPAAHAAPLASAVPQQPHQRPVSAGR